MKPLTLRTALAFALAALAAACQPTAPAPTLTELMIAPVKAPSAPAPTPTQSLPPLAFGWRIGETIPYTEDLTVKTATTAPVPLDPGAAYVLSYYKGRLLKVVAISTEITGDPNGSDGKKMFKDLLTVFTERYGKPIDLTQVVGRTLYRDADEYYECLKYTGCGLWQALFKTPEKIALLRLYGTGRGSGYMKITVEAAEWSGVVDQINAAKTKALSNSL